MIEWSNVPGSHCSEKLSIIIGSVLREEVTIDWKEVVYSFQKTSKPVSHSRDSICTGPISTPLCAVSLTQSCYHQAHRLADGYNREFLRVLRQLRDLRRYTPVVIQNAQQVNVGSQQPECFKLKLSANVAGCYSA